MTEFNELEHFGVLGMKWGIRKDKGSSSSTTTKKKLTRKEVKAEKQAYYQNRAENAVKTASEKGKDALIYTWTKGNNMATIMSGREFMSYLESGGAIDVKMTDVYATAEKSGGEMTLNENFMKKYTRSDKQ